MGLHPVYDQLTQNLEVPGESWRGGGQGNTEHQNTGGNFWWLVVCSYTYTAAIIVCSLFAIRFLHLYLGHLEDDFIQSVDINIMYIYIYISTLIST